YIERNYNGVKSTPWEGGQYGFVRDPTDTAGGVVYTRFHEGIDIRPLHRDAHGEPLDEVRAIADGKVTYTNLVPGYSNYGKYIVIEHHWDSSSYYSLYGHLSSIAVQSGDTVNRGQRIAVMGYTGTGLNRERAHLHLELNLMLSEGNRSEKSSWEVSFAQSGVPLRIESSDKNVTQPELSYARKSSVDYSHTTRDVISGHGASAHLTDYGRQLMRLLIWPD